MKRDANKVWAVLSEDKDGQFTAQKDMYIDVPQDFETRGLLKLKEWVAVVGSYLIGTGDYYAVMNANVYFEMRPHATSIVKVKDESFYRFTFQKGDVVIRNTTVLRNKQVPIDILFLYILRGVSPWYITPEDKARCLETAGSYADINLGDMPELIEVLVSQGLRDSTNLDKLARLAYKTTAEMRTKSVEVALSNVAYGPGTTFGKITGSNQHQGLVGSLVTDNEVASEVEIISRA